MVQCQYLLMSGPHKGTQCQGHAKFPPEKPVFCGRHVNCQKKISQPTLGECSQTTLGEGGQTILGEGGQTILGEGD